MLRRLLSSAGSTLGARRPGSSTNDSNSSQQSSLVTKKDIPVMLKRSKSLDAVADILESTDISIDPFEAPSVKKSKSMLEIAFKRPLTLLPVMKKNLKVRFENAYEPENYEPEPTVIPVDLQSQNDSDGDENWLDKVLYKDNYLKLNNLQYEKKASIPAVDSSDETPPLQESSMRSDEYYEEWDSDSDIRSRLVSDDDDGENYLKELFQEVAKEIDFQQPIYSVTEVEKVSEQALSTIRSTKVMLKQKDSDIAELTSLLAHETLKAQNMQDVYDENTRQLKSVKDQAIKEFKEKDQNNRIEIEELQKKVEEWRKMYLASNEQAAKSTEMQNIIDEVKRMLGGEDVILLVARLIKSSEEAFDRITILELDLDYHKNLAVGLQENVRAIEEKNKQLEGMFEIYHNTFDLKINLMSKVNDYKEEKITELTNLLEAQAEEASELKSLVHQNEISMSEMAAKNLELLQNIKTYNESIAQKDALISELQQEISTRDEDLVVEKSKLESELIGKDDLISDLESKVRELYSRIDKVIEDKVEIISNNNFYIQKYNSVSDMHEQLKKKLEYLESQSEKVSQELDVVVLSNNLAIKNYIQLIEKIGSSLSPMMFKESINHFNELYKSLAFMVLFDESHIALMSEVTIFLSKAVEDLVESYLHNEATLEKEMTNKEEKYNRLINEFSDILVKKMSQYDKKALQHKRRK